MFLSTRSRYGLRAVFSLALSYGLGPLSLSAIAEKEGISLNYLEQLFLQLKKNNLVISIRGVKGGYTLASHPKDITVGDVIRSLENSFLVASCVEDNIPCIMQDTCASRIVWEKMTDAVNKVIDSITLQDMIKDHNEKIQKQQKSLSNNQINDTEKNLLKHKKGRILC